MEQQHLWPGRSLEPEPEPEPLHLRSSTIPQYSPPQCLPPASLSMTDGRGIGAETASGSRRRHLHSRQNWPQPIEALVQRLRTHSLKPRRLKTDNRPDSTNIPCVQNHDRILQTLRRGDDSLMDIDELQDEEKALVPVVPVPFTTASSTEQPLGQDSTDSLSPLTRCYHYMPQLQAESHTPSPTTHLAPITLPHESSEPVHQAAHSETDPKQSLGWCEDLDVDEGYGDGVEDYAWASDSRSLIQSLAKHARQSGALKYKTSTEAALECTQIVHKAPRMRRRRHKKNQTRLRASSTASTCGFDAHNTPALDTLADHEHVQS
jgi:hypothetical protein